jgi:hypothetical protein
MLQDDAEVAEKLAAVVVGELSLSRLLVVVESDNAARVGMGVSRNRLCDADAVWGKRRCISRWALQEFRAVPIPPVHTVLGSSKLEGFPKRREKCFLDSVFITVVVDDRRESVGCTPLALGIDAIELDADRIPPSGFGWLTSHELGQLGGRLH